MSCICVTKISIKKLARCKLRANNTVYHNAQTNLSTKSNFRKVASHLIGVKSSVKCSSSIKNRNTHHVNLIGLKTQDNFNINSFLIVSGVFHARLSSVSKLETNYTEKLGGSLVDFKKYNNFGCIEKIYPTLDIINDGFVDKNLNTQNIYESIDEGILSKETDGLISYIQPSAIDTVGQFRYKFRVEPYIRPQSSYLLIRASAPFKNYGSKVAPLYKFSNIRFEDPSGNLIIKYKDFTVRGDADYDTEYVNFATYITEPEINNAALNYWNTNYPFLASGANLGNLSTENNDFILNENNFFIRAEQGSDGYTVSLDISSECLDIVFDEGYDKGYEEIGCRLDRIDHDTNDYLSFDGAPISTQKQGFFNITNNLRITAIELCNSGSFISYNASFTPLYTETVKEGLRLSRNIRPSKFLASTHTNNIFPDTESVWAYTDPEDVDFNNITESGSSKLLDIIRRRQSNVRLDYSSIEDSGKLHLVFSHERPPEIFGYRDGAFSFSTNVDSSDFNMARYSRFTHDHFFTVDKIELKVIARKAPGSRDYALDIVGYSDDRLLNVTSDIGGFLQNDDSDLNGTVFKLLDEDENAILSEQSFELNTDLVIPNILGDFFAISGFKPINDLGISSEAISDKYQYFDDTFPPNSGGDHYVLSNRPLINSTSFKEYTIPLKIYEDRVDLGKSTDYSMSSYFEKLFLDIYPIPSGAQIAEIYLTVYYKPSNALMMHTIGQPKNDELARRDVLLFPIASNQLLSENKNSILSEQNFEIIIDTYSSGSLIENIPHAFSRDITLKTNYSTRWKSVLGKVVAGPFDPLAFDFSFYNPEMYTPFINGFFSFNQDNKFNFFVTFDDELIVDQTDDPIITIQEYENFNIISDYSFEKRRLPSVKIGEYISNYDNIENRGLRFVSDSLFNESTSYKTIDWTSISGYENHELKGRISDNFENAVRVSGDLGYIKFNGKGLPTESGFAVYLRFSPDISMSGEGYNLWNSGVLFNKGSDFSLEYNDGKLTAKCLDINNNVVSIQDSNHYYNYYYPLSVMVSYNENDNKLRLYTNNLVATSDEIFISSSNDDLIFGTSVNAFITNIGISTNIDSSGINILSGGETDKRLKQQLYSEFLDNTLFSYINKNNNDWKLGDYNLCSFNHEFSRFTIRPSNDFIYHQLLSDGNAYSTIVSENLPEGFDANKLSYHTQIENDFIRFSLSDSSQNQPFYFADKRICKTLPRGYQFEKEAIAVDTIIQYETHDDIVWEDGNVGPKLIVSLYSPEKEPKSYPTFNYGLVNRDIHYLKPSGCWKKITSSFDFNKLIDSSEPWSKFNTEKYLDEFNHSYYSKDIDDMFLQYDIVYPSGKPFHSSLRIHNANVRLKNAFVSSDIAQNSLNIYTSGEGIRFDSLNLALPETLGILQSGLNLIVSGEPIGLANSGINLYVSGIGLLDQNFLSLYTSRLGRLSNFGGDENFGSSSPNFGFGLYCSGQLFVNEDLPLFVQNRVEDQTVTNSISLVSYSVPRINQEFNDIDLFIRGFDNTNFTPESTVNLYTAVSNVGNLSEFSNLFIKTFESPLTLTESNIGLFTVNTAIIDVKLGSQGIRWDSKNIGVNIRVDDNKYSSLRADDEIRGVTTICFGDCK
jgi:hypothetical protein